MSIMELKQSLKAYLAQAFGTSAEVVEEYLDSYVKKPIKGGVISIGIEKISTSNSATGYLGADSGGELYGKALDITLRFDIIRHDKAQECHLLFEMLCTALFEQGCPVAVSQLWCEQLTHDRLSDGFMLTAKATVQGFAVECKRAQPIEGYILRKVN